MFIRTITDRNGLQIVIDVSNDETLVNSTAFDWINVNNQTAAIGDYYYDGKIISPNSPEYESIISPVIFSKEEEHKQQAGLTAPETPVYTSDPPVEPVVIESEPFVAPPAPVSDPGVEFVPLDIDNTPPPIVPDFSDLPLDQQNLDEWKERESNIRLYYNRLSDNNGIIFANSKVTFDPPLVYPNGFTQGEFYATGHKDLGDLTVYIGKVLAEHEKLISRLETYINSNISNTTV